MLFSSKISLLCFTPYPLYQLLRTHHTKTCVSLPKHKWFQNVYREQCIKYVHTLQLQRFTSNASNQNIQKLIWIKLRCNGAFVVVRHWEGLNLNSACRICFETSSKRVPQDLKKVQKLSKTISILNPTFSWCTCLQVFVMGVECQNMFLWAAKTITWHAFFSLEKKPLCWNYAQPRPIMLDVDCGSIG